MLLIVPAEFTSATYDEFVNEIEAAADAAQTDKTAVATGILLFMVYSSLVIISKKGHTTKFHSVLIMQHSLYFVQTSTCFVF
jgi:hypothetical protein